MADNGKRLSCGDRRRNERLARLRSIVRPELAIVAVDLAAGKQAAVVADHDSRTLARRMFFGSPWIVEEILDWAAPVAAAAGFTGVVLACEPTGHRWKPLWDRARAREIEMVCVQPLLVHRAREGEDFTKDRSDYKDATLIARLTGELRCYIPFVQDGRWSRLRHLGSRRYELVVDATAARQALRDLLECAWPSVLATAKDPLDSVTWRACMDVAGCDPEHVRAMSLARFERAVRARLTRWGATRPYPAIIRAVHAAATDPGGIEHERRGALERAHFQLGDWQRALESLTDVEGRMVAVLEELGLAKLVCTIPGLSAVGAAAILAECGDPTRYDTGRALVKHAGLCPRANESGTYRGLTKVSGRGRPLLRTAAWRAIWGLLPHNPLYQQRYEHLTRRAHNPLHDAQARAALAAMLLRHLHAVITSRVAWNPDHASTTKETNQAA